MDQKEIAAFLQSNLIGKTPDSITLTKGRTGWPEYSNWSNNSGVTCIISIGDHNFGISNYTAGGAEPDPYVDLAYDNQPIHSFASEETKDFILITNTNSVESFSKSNLAFQYNEIDETAFSSMRLGKILALNFNVTESFLFFENQTIQIKAGMTDMIQPDTPEIRYYLKNGLVVTFERCISEVTKAIHVRY